MIGFDKIGDLLQQEVSRKEFLRYAGIALLGAVGVTSMLNNLHNMQATQTPRAKRSAGYGVSAYGR